MFKFYIKIIITYSKSAWRRELILEKTWENLRLFKANLITTTDILWFIRNIAKITFWRKSPHFNNPSFYVPKICSKYFFIKVMNTKIIRKTVDPQETYVIRPGALIKNIWRFPCHAKEIYLTLSQETQNPTITIRNFY